MSDKAAEDLVLENWSNVEGMIIACKMEPEKLARAISKANVVARLEWYDDTPQLMGINVAYDGTNIGTLRKRDKEVKPGPTLEEFADAIATQFEAEVMIGDVAVDKFVGDAKPIGGEAGSEEGQERPFRVVEISATPTSAVPLLAAFEGVDIAEIEQDSGKSVLLAQLPEHKPGWHFGDFPFVTLTMHGDEFQVQFVKDEHFETVVSYNWGLNELTIAGGKGWEKVDFEDLDQILGLEDDIREIFEAVPGFDLEEALAATKLRGPAAVRKFVKALGLPQDVSDYLLGWLPLDLVEDAKLHHARGISNAIGRSVDILIDERKDGSKFWDTYSKTITEKPWLVTAVASVEAAVGAGLVYATRRGDAEKRSGVAKLGTAVGAGLLLDSVAEVALAKYTKWREMRRADR